jgi:hypothetical protein
MAIDLHSTLSTRLLELEERRQKLELSLERMNSELAKVVRQIDGYRMIMVLEGAELPDGSILQVEAPADHEQVRSEPANPTKASQIRRFLASVGIGGVEAKQVAHYVKANGISPHSAFAYNVLKRLKENGELLSDGDRYFPTGKLLEALGQEKISFSSEIEPD